MMKRIYEFFAVIVLLAAASWSYNAAWSEPGLKVRNVPKNVRSNPGTYRAHYRSFYIYRGGK
jgi:hypothetical protein